MEKLSKKQRTFKLLTHSARVLFEQRGIEGVTFDDIAEHANVCRTTVFNHFPSGKDLLIALCSTEINNLINHCANCNLQGLALIKSVFGKLIDDTCSYPVVMSKLTTSYVTQRGAVEGGAVLEKTIAENLTIENKNRPLSVLQKINANEAMVMIFGFYYGMVNDYHITDKHFEAAKMKEWFNSMVDKFIC